MTGLGGDDRKKFRQYYLRAIAINTEADKRMVHGIWPNQHTIQIKPDSAYQND